MATIYFLNVKEGDCCIIKHNSGNTTVIDASNANRTLLMTGGKLGLTSEGI